MSRQQKPAHLTTMVTGRVALAGLLGLLGFAGCSSKGLIFTSAIEKVGPSDGGGGAPISPIPPLGGFAGVIQTIRDDAGDCQPFRIDPMQSAAKPPGLLLLIDNSQGMAEPVDGKTWWDMTSSGITDFLYQPNPAFNVGVEYFPAQTVADACSANYDRLDIPVASVGDAQGSFVNSLMTRTIGGPSALPPALVAALQHMRDWAAQLGRPAAVVVLTHEGTKFCSPAGPHDLAAYTSLAWSSDPKIATHVIGLGDSLVSLNEVAQSGGTNAVTIISGDVRAGVRRALTTIVTDAMCTFTFERPPRAHSFSVSLNVLGSGVLPIRPVPGAKECEADPKVPGGFYLKPGTDSTITFCPATCATLPNWLIEVEFHCMTP